MKGVEPRFAEDTVCGGRQRSAIGGRLDLIDDAAGKQAFLMMALASRIKRLWRVWGSATLKGESAAWARQYSFASAEAPLFGQATSGETSSLRWRQLDRINRLQPPSKRQQATPGKHQRQPATADKRQMGLMTVVNFVDLPSACRGGSAVFPQGVVSPVLGVIASR